MGKSKHIAPFDIPELQNAAETLLANIRFMSFDNPIKTITVTSSVPNEGKTTVSSNLACAMSAAGSRVLLIDCDMRRRSLGARLGIFNPRGIYSVLAGACTVAQAISYTPYRNLFFMDTESSIPSPPDILSSKRFEALLSTLKTEYDYVVLDTPPLGAFVDAAVVGSMTDATIIAVHERSTKRTAIKDALQQLENAGAHVIGAVMTFTHEKKKANYYSYYDDSGKRMPSHNEIAASGIVNMEENFDLWAARTGVHNPPMLIAGDDAADPYTNTEVAVPAPTPELPAVKSFSPALLRSAPESGSRDSRFAAWQNRIDRAQSAAVHPQEDFPPGSFKNF